MAKQRDTPDITTGGKDMENTITVALVQYENRTGNRIGSCDLCYGPAYKIHEGTLVETEFGFGKVIETDLIFTGADKLFQMLQKNHLQLLIYYYLLFLYFQYSLQTL